MLRQLRAALLLTTLLGTAATAQDVQYKSTMQMSMTGMSAGLPSLVTTTSAKGALLRLDTDMDMGAMGGMKVSFIIDGHAHKTYMINHNDKSYRETASPLTALDSAADQMGMGAAPVTTDLHEDTTINGYAARHLIATTEMPATNLPLASLKPDSKLLVVMDAWISSDTALAAVYKHVTSAMAMNSRNPFMAMAQDTQIQGFPLRMTILIVQVPKAGTVDAQAILKGAPDASVVMKTVAEITSISVAPLPDSLFKVPADYTRAASWQ